MQSPALPFETRTTVTDPTFMDAPYSCFFGMVTRVLHILLSLYCTPASGKFCV